MLNLNDLYLFVQVADHKGFAAASRALSIPKSTLAKRIADLEHDLNVRLIQRTSRSFIVTEIGQDLYRHATAMLIEAEAAENMLKGRLSEPSGVVRLATSSMVAQIYLANLLPELALLYPKIHIVLHATDRFVDVIQEGFDIALRAHHAPLPSSDLIQRRIGNPPNYLVASQAYLDQYSTPQLPEELADHEGLLSAATGKSLVWSLQSDRGKSVDVQPKLRFVSDEPVTLIQAAIAGLGIAALPTGLCSSVIKSGRLVRVLPKWNAGSATVTILTPHRRGQLPSVRIVVDFLVNRLSAEMVG